MKQILLTMLLTTYMYASIDTISSFEADFAQSITDEKDKVLVYNGHVVATKPQNAKWNYLEPVKKDVYISKFKVTIVEPEIEQVILKKIESNFDFFKIIGNAKQIKKNIYVANYKNSSFTIVKNNDLIESISYIDEFENRVKILFKNQKQNHKIDSEVFTPHYPLYFDVIRD
ncbi:MAG: LolA-like outer membrane lipoprotein chaperone [Sulfurimonas sp.]|uniref:LolA-like outer membrane lipoprotein chaperone n=1 Tax=Sulfurimonas sp. TaxID=2022749 RepID=UPI0026379EE8|nr:LolA-like outer membrane lipoprotein chaperone [Sulfurimonas sp.]MCW8894537.1 LolA-like outer membrane lipoprotein chaperone [Sulfurimonas sp.]MCW8953900.1 LolA-like outer membrane lipoprotein chaperone [Sulfurimonas sp.]MCW9067357.1 LolA-like outer membrane lipoprotein chaperone [Sulfurimonas sp.]